MAANTTLPEPMDPTDTRLLAASVKTACNAVRPGICTTPPDRARNAVTPLGAKKTSVVWPVCIIAAPAWKLLLAKPISTVFASVELVKLKRAKAPDVDCVIVKGVQKITALDKATLVADASPRLGVTRVGEIANTLFPEPLFDKLTNILLEFVATALEADKPDSTSEVPVATPTSGVTRVGDEASTLLPEPGRGLHG